MVVVGTTVYHGHVDDGDIRYRISVHQYVCESNDEKRFYFCDYCQGIGEYFPDLGQCQEPGI